MDEGILSFSLNGKYLRRAFKEDNLTGNNFEIFPAVSLVYSGECKLILKDQIPDIFFENN